MTKQLPKYITEDEQRPIYCDACKRRVPTFKCTPLDEWLCEDCFRAYTEAR